jgi:acyl carrier protein
MADIRDRLEKFILEDLLLGDASRMPGPADSLVETGVIDSTGILELIEFLEQEFGVHVADDETTPQNLDGIARLEAFVDRKTAAVAS